MTLVPFSHSFILKYYFVVTKGGRHYEFDKAGKKQNQLLLFIPHLIQRQLLGL